MKIAKAKASLLTINGGSSSIKFALFENSRSLRRVLQGRVEGIGSAEAQLVVKGTLEADNSSQKIKASDHTAAGSMRGISI